VPRFHHLWIVEAELEIRNPSADAVATGDRVYAALERYATEDTAPYPTQCRRTDDGWLELAFPVWAPNRWAAVAAGATVLAEACAHAEVDVGTVRMAAGESFDELRDYRSRIHQMEATAD
jgi:hypothetical protein